MPSNCEEVQLHDTVRAPYSGETDLNGAPIFSSESTTTYSKPRMPSQSMPNGSVQPEAASKRLNDKRTKFFKTWYGKLEAKLSILHGRVHTQSVEDDNNLSNTENPLPVDSFVKALEDPHVQTPKVCSRTLLCVTNVSHPRNPSMLFLLMFQPFESYVDEHNITIFS
ncbi:uncharacterized protein LOC124819831 [Vigna umbellata]|uniref:uncharacterized protein LOC124819831 n=1 Tax=Vigna umbellata TaxID=87088 RepID=UPI001F5E52F3|nr:uncharacterized protein LOC124819831 [Vigna umbellata]